jgi:hypothetical protein
VVLGAPHHGEEEVPTRRAREFLGEGLRRGSEMPRSSGSGGGVCPPNAQLKNPHLSGAQGGGEGTEGVEYVGSPAQSVCGSVRCLHSLLIWGCCSTCWDLRVWIVLGVLGGPRKRPWGGEGPVYKRVYFPKALSKQKTK